MSIGEACHECGKIWTKEDEKELNERVAKSLMVEPITSPNASCTKSVAEALIPLKHEREWIMGSDNQGCTKSKGCGQWFPSGKYNIQCGIKTRPLRKVVLCDGCDKTDSANKEKK